MPSPPDMSKATRGFPSTYWITHPEHQSGVHYLIVPRGGTVRVLERSRAATE